MYFPVGLVLYPPRCRVRAEHVFLELRCLQAQRVELERSSSSGRISRKDGIQSGAMQAEVSIHELPATPAAEGPNTEIRRRVRPRGRLLR